MIQSIRFEFSPLPASTAPLRERVREFIARELGTGAIAAGIGPGINRHSPELSRRCGEEGFIGMTWPRRYGGGERSFLERYVVTEELLAAGAPVVKEQGTNWEQALPARARELVPNAFSDPGNRVDFDEVLRYATLIAPKLTIQGGTREILRGIVARGLGLR